MSTTPPAGSGTLQKLRIEAYRSIDCDPKDLIGEPFVAQFNPAAYALKYELEYGKQQGMGTSATPQRFSHIKPQKYTFELVLDGTGAAGPERDVAADVRRFMSLTARVYGEIHRPPFLRLSWGELVLCCVLDAVDIQYTYFRPDGHPLRAKLTASFSEAMSDAMRALRDRFASPDLTHERTVKAGDTLPLLVHAVYGSTAHVVDVARFNGLRGLWDVRPGQVLRFPPLVARSTR